MNVRGWLVSMEINPHPSKQEDIIGCDTRTRLENITAASKAKIFWQENPLPVLVKTPSSIKVIQPNTTMQTPSLQKHMIIDMYIIICLLFILWHHPKYARNIEGYIPCSEGFSLSDKYSTTIKG